MEPLLLTMLYILLMSLSAGPPFIFKQLYEEGSIVSKHVIRQSMLRKIKY